jgi:ribosomal protein S5
MAAIVIPNTFVNATPAVASEVNANFAAIKVYVEALAAGTGLDAGSVTFAKLAADVLENIVTSGDAAQTVLGAQVFG